MLRRHFSALACALVWFLSSSARAAPLSDEDDPARGPFLEARDVGPHELWADAAASGSLWLSVQAQAVTRASGKRNVGGFLLLGIPLERLGRPARRATPRTRLVVAQSTAPKLKPPLRPIKATTDEVPPKREEPQPAE